MRVLGAALFCLVCGLFAFQAQAQYIVTLQVKCIPAKAMTALMKRDGFSLSSFGEESSGEISVIWRKGGEWRFTTTMQSGRLICGVMGGKDWQTRDAKPRGTDS